MSNSVTLGVPPRIFVGQGIQFWRRGQPQAAIVLDENRKPGEYPEQRSITHRLLVIDRDGDQTVEDAGYGPKQDGCWSLCDPNQQIPLSIR